MGNWARRQVLGWLAAGATAPLLGGCARGFSASSADRDLQLLYVADTLDAREPGWPVVPRVRLGPAGRIGAAPWRTGADAARLAPSLAPLLDAGRGDGQRYGGYAALACQLTQLRTRQGATRSLTLENGQCWNGSGLTQLTRGEAGVEGSQLLGSEVRVSSDERLLWPERSAALYRRYGRPVLGATLTEDQRTALGVAPFALIERDGVRIALVGVTDPYASDQQAPLADWYARLRPVLAEARGKADLLVVLADVGSGPGLWLAERLEEADLLLCARGQDLWPELIPVMRGSGRPLPVCLPGCRGVGIFEIRCRGGRDGWRLDAVFHPVQAKRVPDRALLEHYQRQLARARAPHAGWLDQRLARAPVDLWRRDLLGGSWDALIAAALGGGDAQPVLLPGLRYDLPLRRGDWITREHLIALCGGHEATVLDLPTSADGLRTLLEDAADNRFGEPLLLDNSQDLPRLLGVPWTCRYGAPRGQRIGPLQAPLGASFTCRTFALGRELGTGEALWQRLEAYLRARPADWGLVPLAPPRLEFVEGHPGWHPLAALRRRLESLA